MYATPVLMEDLEVTGPVRPELYIGSLAVDADFTGRLVNIWLDGSHGIRRTAFRGGGAATPLK